MPRKIIFIKSLLLSLIIIGNVFAAEITIIPLKKPVLDEAVQRERYLRVFLNLSLNHPKK